MLNFREQFEGLDLNDPASWPTAPKLALMLFVFCMGCAGVYFFDTQSQMAEVVAMKMKEVELKQSYVEKKAVAVNLDLYKKRLQEIDVAFGALLRQLPDKSEVDRLILDINQAGLAKGLQFELFKPAAQEEKKDFYAELPVEIMVTGDYHRLGGFASDVAQLSRIVTLNDVSITPGKDGLTMSAKAKTFRYLSDDEVASQKKAADAAKKAGQAPGQPVGGAK
jgi:type IV pilus assembly protein PilO